MPREPRLFFDEATLEHDTGPVHPERPDRLVAIREEVAERFAGLTLHTAPPCSRDDLARFHTPEYVGEVLGLRGISGRLDPDTPVSPGSVDAAELAAGMAVAAVEWAVDEREPAFALVRPPGHHAERDRGMGFCLFGNVAVAVERALGAPNIDRVLVVDWDVHHGNGTQQAFYDREEVLFFSTHQHPFYPGTGELDETGRGHGEGTTINVPLPAGSGDGAVLEAFETILVPAARHFDPDLVVVSAGYDAHCLDPVGGMQMTTDGFGAAAALVDRLAHECAEGRLAMVLEGGYHLDALARSVARTIEVLSAGHEKFDAQLDTRAEGPAKRALQRARAHHN